VLGGDDRGVGDARTDVGVEAQGLADGDVQGLVAAFEEKLDRVPRRRDEAREGKERERFCTDE
jgi:hypothetical protein